MAPKSDSNAASRRTLAIAKKPHLREKALNNIWGLRNLAPPTEKKELLNPSCCELSGIVIFLLLSITIFISAEAFPAPSVELRRMIGPAPPAIYINIAFAIYLISEVYAIIIRIGADSSARFVIKQLLFFALFFSFFWSTEMLQENFSLLVISGTVLQTMECFRKAHIGKTAAAEKGI